MAFNPFHAFRKHQKFWMASLILVAMFTFVLCQGAGQGDLYDRAFGWINRPSGTTVAVMYGRDVSSTELHKLKLHRNIANEYMKRLTEYSRERLKTLKKEMEKAKGGSQQRGQQLMRVQAMIEDLDAVMARGRYFEGDPGKLESLLDFMLWQHQADRLGITLYPQQINEEVLLAIHGGAYQFSGYEDARFIKQPLRETFPEATESVVMEALQQEFRVRIAKLVLMDSRPYAVMMPGALELARKREPRVPLTPEQLYESYRKTRSPFDVTLIEVPVANYLGQVPQPNEAQLSTLFKQRQKERYDPTLPHPGFERPAEVKVTWVTADPESKYYKRVSQVVRTLEAAPPAAWYPALPGLGQLAAHGGAAAAWRKTLQDHYDNLKKNPARLEEFRSVGPLDPHFAPQWHTSQYELKPLDVATMVGMGVQPGLLPAGPPAAWQAAATTARAGGLTHAVEAEAKQRAPLGVGLLLSSTQPTPFALLAGYEKLLREQPLFDKRYVELPMLGFLPLDAAEAKVREDLERTFTGEWTREVMGKVRESLEKNERGSAKGLEYRLVLLQEKFPGLEVHRSTQRDKKDPESGWYNQYNIENDPAMRGFKEAFEKGRHLINQIEGRDAPERQLKEGDFHRLFFGGDSFSVGNVPAYDFKVWPPVVTPDQRKFPDKDRKEGDAPRTVDLWEQSNKPILFWKTEARPSRPPESLDEVRPLVVEAWKTAKAREEFALKTANDIALAVADAGRKGDDYQDVMALQAAKNKLKLVPLEGISPLVPADKEKPGPRLYEPYKVKRGLIPHPREDAEKQLLALIDLSSPLKADTGEGKKSDLVLKQLDALNKKLYDRPSLLGGKRVQILTNQPQTVFYVAAVTKDYHSDGRPFAFFMDYKDAAGIMMRGDSLFEHAQERAAKEYEERFLQQMRREAGHPGGWDITDRSGFDSDGGS